MTASSGLADALEAGAGEAIAFLRAVVERGHKTLKLHSRVNPGVFTTTVTCATTAAKALANLQLRLNEAVWRRGGGEDVMASILKRIEEAESKTIPQQ